MVDELFTNRDLLNALRQPRQIVALTSNRDFIKYSTVFRLRRRWNKIIGRAKLVIIDSVSTFNYAIVRRYQ